MHALSHSIAHRAPSATRTRVRWQPYNSTSSSLSIRSPQTSYLTPSSVKSESPSPSPCEYDRNSQPPPSSIPPEPQTYTQSRDLQKNKYAISLVDQAVKSLCDIWKPQDIPTIFLTSSRATVGAVGDAEKVSRSQKTNSTSSSRNNQLPSPISPSTHPSPISLPAASSSSSYPSTERADHCSINESLNENSPVHMKGFVHEVLRRSRTSGSVLQTALCYLEAIRSKLPALILKEQNGEGALEPDLTDRISQLEDEHISEMSVDSQTDREPRTGSDDSCSIKTVRMLDGASQGSSGMGTALLSDTQPPSMPDTARKPKGASTPLAPLPPLPSPLLCPRRAFLASLILASKFTQDRCYSNRAWAKLSGLPPREIGRCERALGAALEWRLWVGKTPVTSTSKHSVVRSKSDGDLFVGSERGSSAWRKSAFPAFIPESAARLAGTRCGLKQHASLPTESFYALPPPAPPPMLGLEHTLAPIAAPSVHTNAPDTRGSESSGSPSTPSLTYSPTSTDSSYDGDRTIQMSTVIDETFSTTGCFAPSGETYAKVASFIDESQLFAGLQVPNFSSAPYQAHEPHYVIPLYGINSGTSQSYWAGV